MFALFCFLTVYSSADVALVFYFALTSLMGSSSISPQLYFYFYKNQETRARFHMLIVHFYFLGKLLDSSAYF